MFDSFDIVFGDAFTLEELNRLKIIDGEIERLFYGEYRVVYLEGDGGFVIGYTGMKMLRVLFTFAFEQNSVIIDEIYIADGKEINDLYCRPNCR
ncbi:hypothetical protein [Spirosoma montaniterrae]|uniref:Uncharacterized protein n=1 Tax=Spirosoma montaniterrae TaxID=1178516 RepID=A0A1P9WXZ9_9BACT|nr:hypothetical protein [Spirosoma montaniterrae]AQG80233.1 hypothetical protein AWR27_13445 [Spirosoma montaniterrae]